MTKKRKSHKMSRENDQKNAYISNEMQLQNLSLAFIPENKSLISATRIVSFTHGLQNYSNLGQANFYQLCGLWQVSRQIWTKFFFQK